MSPIEHKPSQNDQRPSAEKPSGDEALVMKRNREGMIFTLLLGAALLSSLYPLPAKLFSGVFAIAALVWAVRYFIAGVRSKQAGGWVIMGVLGALAAGWMILQAIGMAVLYPQQKAYEDCVASALTEQAAVECQSEHRSQLTKMLEELGAG
ncbi:hypothetical protein [Brevibacterium luteolum]|uniref:hypothetical protein n=1 Tax=Brevibacterium luteolum TaxID=199591 RepID=UPI00223B335B|nr:hypothetical protein [Brevibacterium luteolum]MCT1658093.1 hypothetical protein [Brevibacterium luteolum]MCT1921789.1 hypothetical protein [Brevibacterium luteolum]